MQAFLFKIYLAVYNFYENLWKLFFSWFKKILIVYCIEETKIKNITLNYYSGLFLDKYKTGSFYVKMIDADGIARFGFTGALSDICNFKKITESYPLKRKNVILMNKETPLTTDLNILDDYKKNIRQFDDRAIKNLGQITSMMGLNCTHLIIVKTRPFSREEAVIDETDIDYLFD